MFLANRLEVPAEIQAILWDMDGVLIDSLSFDYQICNRLLAKHAGEQYHVSRETIRLNFPFDLPEFWRRLLSATGIDAATAANAELVKSLVGDHQQERTSATFETNPGVLDVLSAATDAGVKMAVVSNNPAAEIAQIIARLELSRYFTEVVGNDSPGTKKKPAPDAYLLAAQKLGCEPTTCMVVEDSLIGAQAGHTAGCYTIGVATGAANLPELESCADVDVCYSSFARENICRLDLGDVKVKSIQTPNDFVSHMIEHLAWRLGLSIDLHWNNTNWEALGSFIGNELAENSPVADSGAAFSMIDDGSAEVLATRSATPGVHFTGANELDLNWFQTLRCEQISDGTPLVSLLVGLAQSSGICFEILVGSLEDPHHTWEGIFRTIGIAMRKIYFEHQEQPAKPTATAPATDSTTHGWFVGEVEDSKVEVSRTTAESSVRVAVDSASSDPSKFVAHVAESIRVEGLADMIDRFASSAQLSIDAEFTSLELSSSHGRDGRHGDGIGPRAETATGRSHEFAGHQRGGQQRD